MKFDLTWGESVIVRQRFVEVFGSPIIFGHKQLESMSYTKHEGELAIVELARKAIKRQTGQEYAHILITNGATGGVTLTLRAYAKQGFLFALTRDPPYFSLYPSMIESAGLSHTIENTFRSGNSEHTVVLCDSPTNPGGKTYSFDSCHMPVIWDAVYHSNCYTPGNLRVPRHDVQVGSFSKLTGLNGLRLGWIATDNYLLYERLRGLVTAEYAGLSRPSSELLTKLLEGKEGRWCEFETMSRYWLDLNRTEWSKLEKFFGGQPVSPVGMFYFAPMDEACRELFDKSGVLYMPGGHFGHSDDFSRFNIGQDAKIIQKAVKAVLKADKI